MIARISGKLLSKKPTDLIVDVNGLGYHVEISLATYDHIGQIGETVTLHTHLHVREDALQLFGFYTERERELFELLITVSGIGPRLALAILSGLSTEELGQAIADGQEAILVGIKGVGRKTAQRLILELKDKISHSTTAPENQRPDSSAPTPAQISEEAVQALIALGFKANIARDVVLKIQKQVGPHISVEEIIRHALKG